MNDQPESVDQHSLSGCRWLQITAESDVGSDA